MEHYLLVSGDTNISMLLCFWLYESCMLKFRDRAPLKEHSHGYFLYFCHGKFAEFISKELADVCVTFRLLREQNKINFQEKNLLK